MCQRPGHHNPKYEMVKEEGSAHEPWFTVEVQVGLEKARGSGRNKKKAKQAAAKVIFNKKKNFKREQINSLLILTSPRLS